MLASQSPNQNLINMNKVFISTIKETGKLTSIYEVFDSFEKAVKSLKNGAKQCNRIIRETDLRNEFRIYTAEGDFIHTILIIDVWVH